MPGLSFQRGDLLSVAFAERSFDLIINCSDVEHVGLQGRYGSASDDRDGDLRAMAKLCQLVKPGGKMLLTIPVGRDGVFAPQHRVYGGQRLPLLLLGWHIQEQEYWAVVKSKPSRSRYPGRPIHPGAAP